MFDSHAHVNFKAFKDDGDEVIKKALENNTWIINIGSEYKTSQRALEYANKYKEGVWAAVGIHPIHLFSSSNVPPEENVQEEFDYDKYKTLAENEKVVAIGEVGLDYHHFAGVENISGIKEKQKKVLKEFISIANKVKKPVVIHCWDAYDDLLEILKDNKILKTGVIHSFIGSWKTAQKFIDLGFKIGLNGIVTYSESYDKLIREINLKDVLIETDCPYLSPKPLDRDSRNEPINVKYVAEKIAEVKSIEISAVEKITTDNAKKLFNIK
jgi:TatD DNase family protein